VRPRSCSNAHRHALMVGARSATPTPGDDPALAGDGGGVVVGGANPPVPVSRVGGTRTTPGSRRHRRENADGPARPPSARRPASATTRPHPRRDKDHPKPTTPRRPSGPKTAPTTPRPGPSGRYGHPVDSVTISAAGSPPSRPADGARRTATTALQHLQPKRCRAERQTSPPCRGRLHLRGVQVRAVGHPQHRER